MPLTVNRAQLSDDCLVKMGEVALHSAKAERAFALCYEDTKIVPSTEHIGGRYSVSYRDCPAPLRKAGTFHTHPHSDSSPSWGDGFAALSNSQRNSILWLGCRGSKIDGRIRCMVPREIPASETILRFRRKWSRMAHEPLESDPEMAGMVREVASFAIRDIPTMLERKVPAVPVPPRIKTEEIRFAESLFMKHINLDTGEERIERVY